MRTDQPFWTRGKSTASLARIASQERASSILRVARDNPDLATKTIAERFGVSDDVVRSLMRKNGLSRRQGMHQGVL